MQKYPVTVQEMDRIAKTIGLTTGYNDRAMKRTCLLVRLGNEPTAELYQRELSISERHPADVAQEIESRIDAELGQHTIISGGEVLELSSAQPADNDNIPF